MSKTTVWFNTHGDVIKELIDGADAAGEFRMVATSIADKKSACDVFEVEPNFSTNEELLDYALNFARKHDVKLFVPGRKWMTFARRKQAFDDAGIKLLLAGDAETLAVINDKGRCYAAIGGDIAPQPEFCVVRSWENFEEVCADYRKRHGIFCFKPAVSIFGYGFRVVADEGVEVGGLNPDNNLVITMEAARQYLRSRSYVEKGLMIMQYLEGTERSVDCLAHNGELVRGIIRAKQPVRKSGSKSANIQLIESNPTIENYTRAITRHLNLHGLYNVQFKDSCGKHYLLEINPRMSGGIPMACMSGVCLPYWALKLAMGTCDFDSIPQAETGFKVQHFSDGPTIRL